MAERTILLVDDDDDIREIAGLALSMMGDWKIVEADRGATALRLARLQRPDVVLLDVMMPDMDGPTTFGHMQADPALRDIPVVLLTAKVQIGHVQVWDSLAVAGVIPKPFDPTTLSAQIEALVAAHLQAHGAAVEPRHTA